jgi:RNA polymerase sigma-70 factor (ECF subfamily)
LIDEARSGDKAAFEQLVAPYQRELRVHCYRILGSLADAEDGLQEALLAAWRGLGGFEGRSSIRTWLYRVATTRCLNMLRSAKRRPESSAATLPVEPPEPTRLGEVFWLEPFPDLLLADISDPSLNHEAQVEENEAISLAFITALQLLPPQQRVALVLCDVLDFPAKEAASMIGATQQALSSALKRARATLAREMPSAEDPPPQTHSYAEEEVLVQLVRAFEEGDAAGLVDLLTDDVWVRMPPVPFEYQGRHMAGRFFATVAFREGRRYRMVPTRANGQPAFGVYLPDKLDGTFHAFGLMVITLRRDKVSAITRFENGVLDRFGLPRTLPR